MKLRIGEKNSISRIENVNDVFVPRTKLILRLVLIGHVTKSIT